MLLVNICMISVMDNYVLAIVWRVCFAAWAAEHLEHIVEYCLALAVEMKV